VLEPSSEREGVPRAHRPAPGRPFGTGLRPASGTDKQSQTGVQDTAQEQRWPRSGAAASEAGVGATLSLQLDVEGANLGALNLYARRPGSFDDESEHVGLLFASHAAVAFVGIQTRELMTRSSPPAT
jgi:GAF domain-containing protein